MNRHISTLVLRCSLLAAALLALATPLRAQTILADGFADSRVAAVRYPTAIAQVPDGRILFSSQLGQIFVFRDGALLETPALDLEGMVCTHRERGLVGMAVDPEFASNRFIYVSYNFNKHGVCDAETTNTPVGRVSRFVLRDDDTIDPASETVLIDNIPSPLGVHNLDDVEFGKDGYLYVSVGDGGCDYAGDSDCFGFNDAARDSHALVGKILRVTRDGEAPPDNPFIGPASVSCRLTGGTSPGSICAEIFAMGLRNPWRLAFDPNAAGTRFFINDVGQDTWEEINEGVAGADYGWNFREGRCQNGPLTECSTTAPPGLTDPVYTYDRAEGCASVT